jgi:TM2 domain-containing membrane protein YozV
MICNECGASLIKTARFCASCGSATYLDSAGTRLQRGETNPINSNQTTAPGLATKPPLPAYTTGPAVAMAPYLACALHRSVVAAGACAGCGYSFCHACLCNANRNYCVSCWARFNPAMQQPPYYQEPYGYGYPQQYNYPLARPNKSPGAALLLSLIMPGAGQLYNGDTGKGILLFFAFWIFVWVFIGWIFWVVAMVDAYQSAQNINLGRRL